MTASTSADGATAVTEWSLCMTESGYRVQKGNRESWKLRTATTDWAIKETFEPPSPTEAEHDPTFQELVAAAGINVPIIQRRRL